MKLSHFNENHVPSFACNWTVFSFKYFLIADVAPEAVISLSKVALW
jgi:hypothetical protein